MTRSGDPHPRNRATEVPVTTRRAFLTGLAALIATPALVRASSLDYVPRLSVAERRARAIWPWVETRPGHFVIPGGREYTLTSRLRPPPGAVSVKVKDCLFHCRQTGRFLDLRDFETVTGEVSYNVFRLYPKDAPPRSVYVFRDQFVSGPDYRIDMNLISPRLDPRPGELPPLTRFARRRQPVPLTATRGFT